MARWPKGSTGNTYRATTPAEVVKVAQERRERRKDKRASVVEPSEGIVLIEHVFASLAESERSFKPWDEAWAKATADGVEQYVNWFKPTARETYVLSVPECLIELRSMRDMRDALNGRTKPRGEPRRICKCPECRAQRRLEARASRA